MGCRFSGIIFAIIRGIKILGIRNLASPPISEMTSFAERPMVPRTPNSKFSAPRKILRILVAGFESKSKNYKKGKTRENNETSLKHIV